MKHDFSRELVSFNLAQDIIQAITLEKETPTGNLWCITGKQIRDLYHIRLGEPPNDEEVRTILQMIVYIGPAIAEDCSSFDLAHQIFHLLEISELDKRGELN